MLNKASDVVAIATGDIHLRHRPPIARAKEGDWYEAMRRALQQLSLLHIKHQCPVLIAGDLFDYWNAPPELINFALDVLPTQCCYAVPGNHDLPHHDFDNLKRSAFETLCRAGRVKRVNPGYSLETGELVLYGFPCGTPVKKCLDPPHTFALRIALIHSYVWSSSTGFPGAPEDQRLSAYEKKALKGYDCAVFGDNHKGFLSKSRRVVNCGAFMRCKTDEVDYRPFVGLVHRGGEISKHFLDTGDDKLDGKVESKLSDDEVAQLDATGFLDELKGLGDGALDFRQAVKEYLQKNKLSKRVRHIILGAMGE